LSSRYKEKEKKYENNENADRHERKRKETYFKILCNFLSAQNSLPSATATTDVAPKNLCDQAFVLQFASRAYKRKKVLLGVLY